MRSNTRVKKYNIFDKFTIELITGNKNYIHYFDNEYLLMNSGSENKIKVTVIVTRKLPERVNNDIARKLKVKNLFTFNYIIRDIDTDNPKIFFLTHFIDKIYINAIAVFLQAQLLEPILYFKLLQYNILFIHAAGVEWQNGACLFPAHGGTGKTSTALKLVNRGFRLLGDDLLLVDVKRNVVNAYSRPFHIFSYNIKMLSGAVIPTRLKLVISLKNILRSFLELVTKDEFLISTRVHAHDLYPGNIYTNEATIKDIIFLKKDGLPETVQMKSRTKLEESVDNIIDSSDLNQSLFDNILLDKQSQIDFSSLEVNALVRFLSKFDAITYLNIRIFADDDWEKLAAQLKKKLAS